MSRGACGRAKKSNIYVKNVASETRATNIEIGGPGATRQEPSTNKAQIGYVLGWQMLLYLALHGRAPGPPRAPQGPKTYNLVAFLTVLGHFC